MRFNGDLESQSEMVNKEVMDIRLSAQHEMILDDESAPEQVRSCKRLSGSLDECFDYATPKSSSQHKMIWDDKPAPGQLNQTAYLPPLFSAFLVFSAQQSRT